MDPITGSDLQLVGSDLIVDSLRDVYAALEVRPQHASRRAHRQVFFLGNVEPLEVVLEHLLRLIRHCKTHSQLYKISNSNPLNRFIVMRTRALRELLGDRLLDDLVDYLQVLLASRRGNQADRADAEREDIANAGLYVRLET